MAEPSKLEEMAHNAPKAKEEESHGKENNHDKKEEKKQTPLEEIAKAAKNISAFTIGSTLPFVWPGDKAVNAVNALPLAAGATVQDIMEKKPVNWVKSAKESLVGTIMAAPLAGIFQYINVAKDYVTNYAGYLPGAATAVASLAAAQGVFIGVYTGLNHIIQNMSFKGLYNKLKTEYWPAVKRTWKYVLPLSMWNVLYIYKFGVVAQMAYGSLMSFLFRLVGPKTEGAKLGNLVSAMNPLPYIGAGASVTYKLVRNTAKELYESAYAIGSGIRNLLYQPSQKAESKPATAAKPAEAPAH